MRGGLLRNDLRIFNRLEVYKRREAEKSKSLRKKKPCCVCGESTYFDQDYKPTKAYCHVREWKEHADKSKEYVKIRKLGGPTSMMEKG